MKLTAKDIFLSTKHNPNHVSYTTVCRYLNYMGFGAHIKPQAFYLGGEKG
jgi:hypothetical protein